MGGCPPSPRNDRDETMMMTKHMSSVILVMMAGKQWGRIYRNTMWKVDAPMTSAAKT